MQHTFFEILPLAVGATFSPTGLLFVTMILSGKGNAKRHAVLFLLGAAIFLVLLAALVMASYKSAVANLSLPPAAGGAADITFGLLMMLIIGRAYLTRNRLKPAAKTQHKRPFVVMGFLYMIINVSTLVMYLAASKIIAGNQVGPLDSLLLFAFLLVVTMLMISFPVAISFLMPRRSERVMGPVKDFMARHGARIAQAYFFAIGVYLMIHGIVRL